MTLTIGLIMHPQLLVLMASEIHPWWNYPGLELWKFFNLAIFLFFMAYFLKRPLTEALRNRRESIRQELIKSQNEMDQALAKLAEIEARVARLNGDVQILQEQTATEAEAERNRINAQSDTEIARLKEQAQREIENAAKIAAQELRRLAAVESVKLAEQLLRADLKPEDDARLIRASIGQLGGQNY